jgi:hypothetical protein
MAPDVIGALLFSSTNIAEGMEKEDPDHATDSLRNSQHGNQRVGSEKPTGSKQSMCLNSKLHGTQLKKGLFSI